MEEGQRRVKRSHEHVVGNHEDDDSSKLKKPKPGSSSSGEDGMIIEHTGGGGGAGSCGDTEDRMEIEEETSTELVESKGQSRMITSPFEPEDFTCSICYQTLFRPVVLPSSGFSACESCLASLLRFNWEQGKIGAQDPVLGERGPIITSLPAVYTQLHSTLDRRFPTLYAERREQVEGAGLADTVRQVRQRPLHAKEELEASSRRYWSTVSAQLAQDPGNARNIEQFRTSVDTFITIFLKSLDDGFAMYRQLRPLRHRANALLAPVKPRSRTLRMFMQYLFPVLLMAMIFQLFPTSACLMPKLRDNTFVYHWILRGRFFSLRVLKATSDLDPTLVDPHYASPEAFLLRLLWPVNRLKFSSQLLSHHRLLLYWYLLTEALGFLYTFFNVSINRVRRSRQGGKSMTRCLGEEICYVVLTCLLLEFANFLCFIVEELGWLSGLLMVVQAPVCFDPLYNCSKLFIGIQLITRLVQGAYLDPLQNVGLGGRGGGNNRKLAIPVALAKHAISSVCPDLVDDDTLDACSLMCTRYVWWYL